MKGIHIDQNKFTILQYGEKYKIQKKCTITNKLYFVYLSKEEFLDYYTQKGKNVSKLGRLSKEQRTFLESTLTPEEVKSLKPVLNKVPIRRWKHLLPENVKKEIVKEILKIKE